MVHYDAPFSFFTFSLIPSNFQILLALMKFFNCSIDFKLVIHKFKD